MYNMVHCTWYMHHIELVYLESCCDPSHPLQTQLGVFNVVHQTSVIGHGDIHVKYTCKTGERTLQ